MSVVALAESIAKEPMKVPTRILKDCEAVQNDMQVAMGFGRSVLSAGLEDGGLRIVVEVDIALADVLGVLGLLLSVGYDIGSEMSIMDSVSEGVE